VTIFEYECRLHRPSLYSRASRSDELLERNDFFERADIITSLSVY